MKECLLSHMKECLLKKRQQAKFSDKVIIFNDCNDANIYLELKCTFIIQYRRSPNTTKTCKFLQ